MGYKDGMTLAVERSDARPWHDDRLEPLFGGVFPSIRR
jgi:hypothetical protein